MKVLLVAPPRTNHDHFRGRGSRASERIHRFFRQIIREDDDSRFLLLDSEHSPKTVHICAEDHLRLAARNQEMNTAALDHILEHLGLEEREIEVMLTWGEWRQLRQATQRLGIHYVSLQHAAPGSKSLDLLHLNAGPVFAVPPGAEQNPLPASASHSAKRSGQARLALIVGPEGESRRTDPLSNLADIVLAKVLPQLKELIGPMMDAGAHCTLIPQEKSATPLARRILQRLARAHPQWNLGRIQPRQRRDGGRLPLGGTSDAVVSINSVAALDTLRQGAPAAFLGRNTEGWDWLNPAAPWPAGREELHQAGLRQEIHLHQAVEQLTSRRHWFPNRHPSPAEFHGWIAAACTCQKGLKETVPATPLDIGDNEHYPVSEAVRPLIPQDQPTLWQRLRNRSRHLRHRLVSLGHAPRKRFRAAAPASTPVLRKRRP